MLQKIFMDTEFTCLDQFAQLISIGLVTDNCTYFAAEFTDYDIEGCSEWVLENVLPKISGITDNNKPDPHTKSTRLVGNKTEVGLALIRWFEQFEDVQIVMDVGHYDWVLFCGLFGGAMNIPKNILYIPMDLATIFEMKGYDPDTSRHEYLVGINNKEHLLSNSQHDALYDAWVTKWCYESLTGK